MASRVTRSRRPPQPQQQEPQSRAKWTTSLTKILADLMVDQVHKGNRQKKSFTKKAWVYMCDDFCKETGLKWEKDQLKNRFGVLRRQYATIKSLLDKGEFSWDESAGTIVGKDEAWENYMKEHPDAESIKTIGCPLYKELCIIFAEPAMNGRYDQSAQIEESKPMLPCPEPLPLFMLQGESSSESEEADDTADEQDKFHCTTPTAGCNRKRGRKGIDDVIASAILEMASASKLRTAAIRQRNARFSISNCVRELDEIQGVDEEVYFSAIDLFDNPIAREMFLSLKADKRLTWLNSKCAAPSIPVT